MGWRILGDLMGEETTIQENILAERYYAPGEKSWEDIAARVGKFIGGTAITTAMIEKKFIPASPFLMNAGTEHPQMFSCFVLPLEDDLGSIFGFYDKSAKIFKSSGGVGANWSKLRPVGSPLSGGGTTSGVVSFMEIFNIVIEKVKQGGKKKGAAICTLDISHPEVENFIKMKLERGKFENFNISPTVTDEFMRRAIAGHEKEKTLFDLIVDCTYNSSEPGMLWIDTANRYCSTPGLGLYESTNPCGERFLFPFECCCLGGINLAYFIRDGHVDWQNLGKTVRLVIRFLDESFDRNEYPLPEIREASQNTRRIGLYPIGLADALIKMRLPYDSQEGREFAEKLWEFINKTAWDESVRLGEKLGTFPAYDSRNPELVPDGARNAAVTCVAPGGTTSLIAGVNFGIEPYVGLVTKREQGSGTGTIVCPLFEEELRKVVSTEIEFNEVLDHAAKNGSIQSLTWLPEDFRRIFVTAQDIHWRDHIDMQAVFQKHCVDGTISKTINLPKSSTKEDIRDAYVYAWQQELRGLTFYREGTRDPVYAFGSGDEDEMTSVLGPGYEVPAKAPAIRYNVKVGCGKMAVFVVGDPDTGEPIELWQIPVSGGGCAGLNSGNGRAISKSLQHGVPPDIFIKSGEHVVCPACAGKPKLDGKSCPSAAARKLREYISDSKVVRTYLKAHHEGSGLLVEKPKEKPQKKNECPACGWPLTYAEGCATCTKCGYSKCG